MKKKLEALKLKQQEKCELLEQKRNESERNKVFSDYLNKIVHDKGDDREHYREM